MTEFIMVKVTILSKADEEGAEGRGGRERGEEGERERKRRDTEKKRRRNGKERKRKSRRKRKGKGKGNRKEKERNRKGKEKEKEGEGEGKGRFWKYSWRARTLFAARCDPSITLPWKNQGEEIRATCSGRKMVVSRTGFASAPACGRISLAATQTASG